MRPRAGSWFPCSPQLSPEQAANRVLVFSSRHRRRGTYTYRETLQLTPDPTARPFTDPVGDLMSKTKQQAKGTSRKELFRALQARFEKNMNRHKGLGWAEVQAKLDASTERL